MSTKASTKIYILHGVGIWKFLFFCINFFFFELEYLTYIRLFILGIKKILKRELNEQKKNSKISGFVHTIQEHKKMIESIRKFK